MRCSNLLLVLGAQEMPAKPWCYLTINRLLIYQTKACALLEGWDSALSEIFVVFFFPLKGLILNSDHSVVGE